MAAREMAPGADEDEDEDDYDLSSFSMGDSGGRSQALDSFLDESKPRRAAAVSLASPGGGSGSSSFLVSRLVGAARALASSAAWPLLLPRVLVAGRLGPPAWAALALASVADGVLRVVLAGAVTSGAASGNLKEVACLMVCLSTVAAVAWTLVIPDLMYRTAINSQPIPVLEISSTLLRWSSLSIVPTALAGLLRTHLRFCVAPTAPVVAVGAGGQTSTSSRTALRMRQQAVFWAPLASLAVTLVVCGIVFSPGPSSGFGLPGLALAVALGAVTELGVLCYAAHRTGVLPRLHGESPPTTPRVAVATANRGAALAAGTGGADDDDDDEEQEEEEEEANDEQTTSKKQQDHNGGEVEIYMGDMDDDDDHKRGTYRDDNEEEEEDKNEHEAHGGKAQQSHDAHDTDDDDRHRGNAPSSSSAHRIGYWTLTKQIGAAGLLLASGAAVEAATMVVALQPVDVVISLLPSSSSSSSSEAATAAAAAAAAAAPPPAGGPAVLIGSTAGSLTALEVARTGVLRAHFVIATVVVVAQLLLAAPAARYAVRDLSRLLECGAWTRCPAQAVRHLLCSGVGAGLVAAGAVAVAASSFGDDGVSICGQSRLLKVNCRAVSRETAQPLVHVADVATAAAAFALTDAVRRTAGGLLRAAGGQRRARDLRVIAVQLGLLWLAGPLVGAAVLRNSPATNLPGLWWCLAAANLVAAAAFAATLVWRTDWRYSAQLTAAATAAGAGAGGGGGADYARDGRSSSSSSNGGGDGSSDGSRYHRQATQTTRRLGDSAQRGSYVKLAPSSSYAEQDEHGDEQEREAAMTHDGQRPYRDYDPQQEEEVKVVEAEEEEEEEEEEGEDAVDVESETAATGAAGGLKLTNDGAAATPAVRPMDLDDFFADDDDVNDSELVVKPLEDATPDPEEQQAREQHRRRQARRERRRQQRQQQRQHRQRQRSTEDDEDDEDDEGRGEGERGRGSRGSRGSSGGGGGLLLQHRTQRHSVAEGPDAAAGSPSPPPLNNSDVDDHDDYDDYRGGDGSSDGGQDGGAAGDSGDGGGGGGGGGGYEEF